MGEEFFTCSLSRAQRITTRLCLVLMVPVSIAIVALAIASVVALIGGKAEAIAIIPVLPFIILAPVLLIILPRYAPAGLAIGSEGIAIVRRNEGRIPLPKHEILSVEPQDRAVFKRCIRGCGVGGYFGSWGYFWSPALKGFRAYITDIDNAVLVRTRTQGLYVLTPDDRDRFIACANEVLNLT